MKPDQGGANSQLKQPNYGEEKKLLYCTPVDLADSLLGRDFIFFFSKDALISLDSLDSNGTDLTWRKPETLPKQLKVLKGCGPFAEIPSGGG